VMPFFDILSRLWFVKCPRWSSWTSKPLGVFCVEPIGQTGDQPLTPSHLGKCLRSSNYRSRTGLSSSQFFVDWSQSGRFYHEKQLTCLRSSCPGDADGINNVGDVVSLGLIPL
jgi:hypothetical protein